MAKGNSLLGANRPFCFKHALETTSACVPQRLLESVKYHNGLVEQRELQASLHDLQVILETSDIGGTPLEAEVSLFRCPTGRPRPAIPIDTCVQMLLQSNREAERQLQALQPAVAEFQSYWWVRAMRPRLLRRNSNA
jgi:hypothetical protein